MTITTTAPREVILCGPCAAHHLHSQPNSLIATGAYSVDGCDRCSDGSAGHQVYEVKCPVYGQDGSRCALPAGHAPAGDGRVHVLVQAERGESR